MIDNELLKLIIHYVQTSEHPRGIRAATIGATRDSDIEATQTVLWTTVQDADGNLLPTYEDAYT